MDNKKTWFDKLADNLQQAFCEVMNEQDYPSSVVACYQFDDGSTIEVELHKNNTLDVYCIHADDEVERECPNITQYLEENLCDWGSFREEYESAEAVFDEWQQHGFRDEADYCRYMYGS